jgi:NAD-dependent DNA ligase
MLTIQEGKQIAKEMFVLGSYEDFSVAQIIELLTLADDLYFNEQQAIDLLEDDQYDALKQYAARLAPANVYFTGVGSSVRGGKITLPFQMGSLNQVYVGGDFERWVGKYYIAAELLVISNKLDGASAMYVYDINGNLQIAYSRGDGVQGADITRHARKLHDVPAKIDNKTGAPVTVRAENIIKPVEFAIVNTGKYARGGRIYKNPRNMVSGLMNSSSLHDQMYDAIDTVAYEIVGSTTTKEDQLKQLKAYGFHVVEYETAIAGDLDEQDLTDILNRVRKNSEYELDGIVIDINSAKIRAKIKTDDLNPEYAVKFKVADSSNYAEARCTNVEWNVSKDGYYKPRVQIEPTNLVGVTITNLTGFNAKFIKENNIGPGAILKITRSGDVIPYILGVATPAPSGPQLPDDGEAVWTDTGVDLVVADVSNNETVNFVD